MVLGYIFTVTNPSRISPFSTIVPGTSVPVKSTSTVSGYDPPPSGLPSKKAGVLVVEVSNYHRLYVNEYFYGEVCRASPHARFGHIVTHTLDHRAGGGVGGGFALDWTSSCLCTPVVGLGIQILTRLWENSSSDPFLAGDRVCIRGVGF